MTLPSPPSGYRYRRVTWAIWLMLGLIVCFSSFVSAQEGIQQPIGYRLGNYDDIVPEQLTGATVVSDEQVQQLQAQGAILIDVIPEVRPPQQLPENSLWLPPPHQTLPKAFWLPDIGYGKLSAVTERYFRQHLERLTEASPDAAVVFFCRDNCWMSWNAAKRALEWGYTSVYWYPEGTDGWFAAGYEFDTAIPEPGARQ